MSARPGRITVAQSRRPAATARRRHADRLDVQCASSRHPAPNSRGGGQAGQRRTDHRSEIRRSRPSGVTASRPSCVSSIRPSSSRRSFWSSGRVMGVPSFKLRSEASAARVSGAIRPRGECRIFRAIDRSPRIVVLLTQGTSEGGRTISVAAAGTAAKSTNFASDKGGAVGAVNRRRRRLAAWARCRASVSSTLSSAAASIGFCSTGTLA